MKRNQVPATAEQLLNFVEADSWRDYAYSIARREGICDADAEDVAAEALYFVASLASIPNGQEASLRRNLWGFIRNRVQDIRRKERRLVRLEHPAAAAAISFLPDEGDTVEALQLRSRLALSTLPKKERDTLRDVMLGVPQTDIAKALGVSDATISRLKARSESSLTLNLARPSAHLVLQVFVQDVAERSALTTFLRMHEIARYPQQSGTRATAVDGTTVVVCVLSPTPKPAIYRTIATARLQPFERTTLGFGWQFSCLPPIPIPSPHLIVEDQLLDVGIADAIYGMQVSSDTSFAPEGELDAIGQVDISKLALRPRTPRGDGPFHVGRIFVPLPPKIQRR